MPYKRRLSPVYHPSIARGEVVAETKQLVDVKNVLRHSMLVLLLAASVVSSAQLRKQVLHRVRVTGAIGYSMDICDRASYGGKSAIGAGYRLQYGHLIFDAGIEGGYRLVDNRLHDLHYARDNKDQQGDTYYGVSDETKRHHLKQRVSVALPLAIGGMGRYVYGTVGLRPAINVWGGGHTDWLYTHVGYYYDANHNLVFMAPVQNNPSAGFPLLEPRSREDDKRMDMEIFGTAEIGLCVDRLANRGYEQRGRRHHYVGVYAEMRLNNGGIGMRDGAATIVVPNDNDEMQVIPLTVGVKYTLEIGMKTKHKCTTCLEK